MKGFFAWQIMSSAILPFSADSTVHPMRVNILDISFRVKPSSSTTRTLKGGSKLVDGPGTDGDVDNEVTARGDEVCGENIAAGDDDKSGVDGRSSTSVLGAGVTVAAMGEVP